MDPDTLVCTSAYALQINLLFEFGSSAHHLKRAGQARVPLPWTGGKNSKLALDETIGFEVALDYRVLGSSRQDYRVLGTS